MKKIIIFSYIFLIFFVCSCNNVNDHFFNVTNEANSEEYNLEKENVIIESNVLFNFVNSGGTPQDIEVYDNYLLAAFSNPDRLRLYSLLDNSLIAEKNINISHGSSMQFSNYYYDKSDKFPLLFAGGWEDNLIHIIRICCKNGDYDFFEIYSINISNEYGYYLSIWE